MRAKVFRPGKRGSAATLGPLEAEIMETIWAAPQPLTVGDVSLRFNNRKPVLAYSTIKAVLSNLARKGHVRKQSAGKANTFLAAQSKVDFERDVVGGVLSSLMRDYRNPLLSHLADEFASDPKVIAQFERLLAERKKRRSTNA